MPRYYFHTQDGEQLTRDAQGTELNDLRAAREHALTGLRQFVGEAIKHGEEVPHAVVITDSQGRRVAAVPIVASLPAGLLATLCRPSNTPPMDKAAEYRKYADECRAMAGNAAHAEDQTSWLKLADAWLHMLPQGPAQQGWPKPRGEDSKASH